MRFRNIGPGGVDAFRPAGNPGARYVAPGEEIDVPGALAEEQPADGYVVEHDGDARVWPASRWQLVGRDAQAWKRLRTKAEQAEQGSDEHGAVGESGPEVFVPEQAGVIVAHDNSSRED